MFFEPFFKSSWGLSNVVFITLHPVTFVSVDDSTFLLYRIFIFGSHQEVLDGSASFEVHFHPIFAANLLNALTELTVVRHYYVWLLDVLLVPELVLLLLSLFGAGFLVFIFILFRAQVGYLHLASALWRWFSSFCSSCGLEQMICALWCKVPIILYLDVKVWWLSHCRYGSVCVGFM